MQNLLRSLCQKRILGPLTLVFAILTGLTNAAARPVVEWVATPLQAAPQASPGQSGGAANTEPGTEPGAQVGAETEVSQAPSEPEEPLALPIAGPSDVPLPTHWLTLARVDSRGRRPFRPDAVFRSYILGQVSETEGESSADQATNPASTGVTAPRFPSEGQVVQGEREEAAWEWRELDERGALSGASGQSIGYACTLVECAKASVVRLSLSGASTLFVNGERFVGDVYGLGIGSFAVPLRAGGNTLFVTGIRGSFVLKHAAAQASDASTGTLFLELSDNTLPDLVRGQDYVGELALRCVNASSQSLGAMHLKVHESPIFCGIEQRISVDLPPFGVTKLPIPVRTQADWLTHLQANPDGPVLASLTVSLGRKDSEGSETYSELCRTQVNLAVRDPRGTRRETFRSQMDDSVQQYSVFPPAKSPMRRDQCGVILSLHGASVDALNQANSYAAKPDLWVVAPTNRRPFGFDWQDWGRRDAYEVLDVALGRSGAHPDKVILTGHSMGGHGTWHLAANDPDRFVAIGPSAGWRSFDTYGSRPEGELRELWHAADASSQTEELLDNLGQLPLYILHGDADNNVPASEAQAMLEQFQVLRAASERNPSVDKDWPELMSHFEPGAGHWWDREGPGAECLDWPEMMSFFRRALTRRSFSEAPDWPTRIAFTSVDPGVDSKHYWLRYQAPLTWGRKARMQAQWDPAQVSVQVTTDNVARFALQPLPFADEADANNGLSLLVDGQALSLDPGDRWIQLKQEQGQWTLLTEEQLQQAEANKSEVRCGPFKRAFENRFVMVYGTGGEPERVQALLARARTDAQVWCYRGNGRARVLSDVEFLARRPEFSGHNLILYGNSEVCSAWGELPESCPLNVTEGRLQLGEQVWEGQNLASFFCYPRRSDSRALVGVFADTGLPGTRVGSLNAAFVSGVGYPDFVVHSSKVAELGDGGVLAAGWFDSEWGLKQEFFLRE